MAALAMARYDDATIAYQVQNVGLVKGFPECISVSRLIPLAMSALVAFGTTLGGYECSLTDELASCGF
jgi:hypothetical protein